VEYDLSTSEDTQEVYDPKTTAALTQQKSEENMGGTGPAGVPGTSSNLPGGTQGTVTVAPETSSSRSESATFAVSKSTRHTTQPAGRIRRLAAAVLVDDAIDVTDQSGKKTPTRRKRSPDEMKQIEQLTAAAIGMDTQRGDMLSIQNLSFQELPVETPPAPGKWDWIRRLLEQWSFVLRYAGVAALFLIVYFLILRPVKKQVLTAFRELPAKLVHANKELSKAEAPTHGVEIELPAATDEARRASALKKQLAQKVRSEPAAASRLVQSWIRDTGKEK
jgi:flagellar M-ring protein FliF